MAEKKEKPKYPEHIQKFYDLSRKVEGAIATTDHHHRKAYLAGEETIINKDGVVEHDLLKKSEFQEKFADAMSDTYFNAAKKYFKVGKDAKGDEIWNQQLIHAYAGTTKQYLLDSIREAKSGFKYDHFNEHLRAPLMKQLREQLGHIPSAHLRDEHIEDILAHTGSKDIVDKDKIERKSAIQILAQFRGEKAVGKSAYRAFVPDYAFKDKTYRTDYVPEKKQAA